MGQVLSIYLPAWDVELVRRRMSGSEASRHSPEPPKRRPSRAVLLFSVEKGQEKIVRCCEVARQAGVLPGMSVAEARALCPFSLRLPFQPDASRQGLLRLAKWCLRFSPVVAIDPVACVGLPQDMADGLLLDVTGEGHLFGGLHLLLAEIGTCLTRLGFSTRLAVAPTIGAAWALSRYGRHPAAIVREEQVDAAIAPLPVAALRLSFETCEDLHVVGIEQVGHVQKLPRESLAARYEGELLYRLDQAFGRIGELIEPLRIVEPVAVRRLFDGAAIQLEAVMMTVQELIIEICRKLEQQESGVRGLRVEWLRINASVTSREWVVGRPCRDPKHLWNLVRPKVESMHLGYGVEAVHVTAYWIETIRHQQTGAWGIGENDDLQDQEFTAFLDTLVSRWGKNNVLAASPVASYVPESARQFKPVHEMKSQTAQSPPLLLMDRPSMLFDQPEPAQAVALQPDHPPSWIKWRGEEYRLADGIGPERIATAWWKSETGHARKTVRDYFKVKTSGAVWLWLFRELETGRWFVHGMWA